MMNRSLKKCTFFKLVFGFLLFFLLGKLLFSKKRIGEAPHAN